MIKRLFGRKLRKSQSVGEEQHNSTHPPGTSNGGHLAVSKTFHGSKGYRPDECRSFMDATSSTGAENARVDPELDRALMQTITDVKYVKRRPKFTAVVDANFQRQCLEAHNLVREKYGSPALIWSQELADLAKSWATNLAERGRVLYPELPGIGENIHLVIEGRDDHLTTGSEIVALWAAEADQFDFETPRWNLKAKNFTQMLWRSSVELGVARFWNTAKNCLAIVAFYRPAGNSNIPREFASNMPLKAAIPEDARTATQLKSLLEQMYHGDLSRVTFYSDLPKSRS